MRQPNPSADPLVGTLLDGRYQIMARIGEGGMGVVYKARQTSIDRILALKMLNQQMAQDPTWVQRFNNEARACSRLQHPNTIRMFDFGQTSDGRLFMTMEFLDGIPLRTAISRGPLPPERVVKILIQCCASLAEAHSIGIIHRDIKPDNVFLLDLAGSPDYVKVLDFSVAKLVQEGGQMATQAGVVFGTPQYMSPEQGRGLPLDARSDLYGLGVLAFEMLTAKVPFNDDNPMTVIQMHLRSELPPLPPATPPSVQALVRRAMEKDPTRRFQSAGEMMLHCQQAFAELSAGSHAIPHQHSPSAGAPVGASPMSAMSAPPAPNAGGYSSGQGYLAAAPMQKTMIAEMPGGGVRTGGDPYGPGMVPPVGSQPYGQPPMASQAPAGQAPAGMMPPGLAGYGQPPYGAAAAGAPAAGAAYSGAGNAGSPQGPYGASPPVAQGAGYMTASPQQKTMIAMAPPVLPGGYGAPPGPIAGPNGTLVPVGDYPNAAPAPHVGGGPQKTMLLQPSEGIVSVTSHGAIAPVVPVPVAGGVAAQPTGASLAYWIVCLLCGAAIGALAFAIVRQM